jgi:hypothetical protein
MKRKNKYHKKGKNGQAPHCPNVATIFFAVFFGFLVEEFSHRMGKIDNVKELNQNKQGRKTQCDPAKVGKKLVGNPCGAYKEACDK